MIHVSLTSALAAGEWSASHNGRFNPEREAPSNHYIGSWVGPTANLGLELRPLSGPARIQTLYRLPYPVSLFIAIHIDKGFRMFCDYTYNLCP